MKKKIFMLIFIMLLITGCSFGNETKNLIEQEFDIYSENYTKKTTYQMTFEVNEDSNFSFKENKEKESFGFGGSTNSNPSIYYNNKEIKYSSAYCYSESNYNKNSHPNYTLVDEGKNDNYSYEIYESIINNNKEEETTKYYVYFYSLNEDNVYCTMSNLDTLNQANEIIKDLKITIINKSTQN